MSKTLITSRDPKGLQTVRLFEDAYNKARLDDERAQRINERGGEFQDGIAKLIAELSVSNQFADEEVGSNYGYPKGWSLKSTSEQLVLLQQIEKFKNLDATHLEEVAKGFSELPEGADGLAVIPKISKVGHSYNEVAELMCRLMAEHRKDWYNYREGCLSTEYLRLTEKTQQALSRLEKETPGDFLIIPTQTGLRHRGRSVRRARAMMSSNEWGLSPYEVGIILLTHPERLQKYEDLAIDCAGCEYCPDADGDFSDCLYFVWSDGWLRFFYGWADDAGQAFGSASAFE